MGYGDKPTQKRRLPLVIVAEGELEPEVLWFSSERERTAFSNGVTAGATLYGSGGCQGVRLPEDLDEWQDDKELHAQLTSEWERARKELASVPPDEEEE
jgi:hypothetical protein